MGPMKEQDSSCGQLSRHSSSASISSSFSRAVRRLSFSSSTFTPAGGTVALECPSPPMKEQDSSCGQLSRRSSSASIGSSFSRAVRRLSFSSSPSSSFVVTGAQFSNLPPFSASENHKDDLVDTLDGAVHGAMEDQEEVLFSAVDSGTPDINKKSSGKGFFSRIASRLKLQ